MLWYEEKLKTPVISTRIRLARNIEGIPFPSRLDKVKFKQVNESLAKAIGKCDFGVKLRKIDMDSLRETESYAMVERHSVSPQFVNNLEGKILFLSENEDVSIMVGEEDHLRIQVVKPGFCLDEAYRLCDKIETEISKQLKFAFDEKYGYLTECPTNLGTGMRASVMLHLPLLEVRGELREISATVGKIGLTFRGFYGEGSEGKASIYQLSNQITLGVSEKTAIENLEKIAKQIVSREEECLKEIDEINISDRAYRSFGALKYARKMSTDEMMKHISMVMLGERAGVIILPEGLSLMQIFIEMQPAMIKRVKGNIEADERDVFRATAIREKLKNI